MKSRLELEHVEKSDSVFPSYVRSLLSHVPKDSWNVQEQDGATCGIVAAANALNILRHGHARYDRNDLLSTAHGWFSHAYGSASFTTEMILRRHGAGTHFGNLRSTNGEYVLRDLIDRGVPVCLELDQNMLGPIPIYGMHTVVLVGYSELYHDAEGVNHEEYYFVDSSYRLNGIWSITSNNVDRDGDGIAEPYPGNRTMPREEFGRRFPTGIYFPVFPSLEEHNEWYHSMMKVRAPGSLLGWIRDQFITGSFDSYK